MKRWLRDRFGGGGGDESAEEVAARHRRGIRAITDAPPPRAGQWLLGTLLLVLVGGLVWASVGRMDVVAFAQGRTVVSSRVQPVQSVERARVTRVLVAEGDRVSANQPVIHLERQSAAALVDELEFRLEHARAARARIQALLAADANGMPRFEAPEGIREGVATGERDRMLSQWAAHREELDQLLQKKRNRKAELETTRARLESLDEILPYLDERVARLERLVGNDAVAVKKLDEARQKLVTKENERRVEERRLEEVRGRVALAERQIRRTRSGFRAELLDTRARKIDNIAQLRQELVDARARLERHTLRAPIAGEVQDVAVHSAGIVVKPADVLMRIVPENRPVEVEAKILNKDIGFAREGQQVDVKFDAFDFTRYGAVPGVIREISRTSTRDKKMGRIYHALVELERNTISADGRRIRLRPGMTTTVDIEIGSRRIIEYFLGPILRYRDEALRER